MATITPEERGSFLHFEDEFSESTVHPEVRPPLSFVLAEYNGFWYRASTPRRPDIYTAIRKPNKGDLLHEIPRIFGSASYYHHDKLSTAFRILKSQANASHKEICLITATFNDDTNIKLRKLDADESNTSMAQRVTEWLRVLDKKGINKDAIVVLEECSDSSLVINGEEIKRLHVHILMVLSESEQIEIKKTLFRRRLHTHTYVDVKTTWKSKWKYSDSEEIEEDQYGSIPQGEVDPNAEHWLNTYVKEVEYFGKKVKMVHRVLPVCMRAADYLSKSIGTPIGSKGRNYAFRELKGREELQIELAKQYAAVKREYA
ncbi:MAG: hypothetical protein GYB23_04820 [Vibrionaceae bacterium]|nr:hypothetical protein [Vibrionaceae bacterium]